jgi:hypothetical protein
LEHLQLVAKIGVELKGDDVSSLFLENKQVEPFGTNSVLSAKGKEKRGKNFHPNGKGKKRGEKKEKKRVLTLQ